jgi:hypothetical protein
LHLLKAGQRQLAPVRFFKVLPIRTRFVGHRAAFTSSILPPEGLAVRYIKDQNSATQGVIKKSSYVSGNWNSSGSFINFNQR